MTIEQSILDQYAAADEDQRIGLYLIHRGLREEFIKIDMAGAAKETMHAPASAATRCCGYFQKFCLGWMKPGRASTS